MADTGSASTQTLAAATNAQVFPKRFGRRIAFSIANVGANAAFINMSDLGIAVANTGVYLAPGGVLSDSNGASYQCWQGSVSGISTAGTTLSIWERVDI